MQHQDRSHSHNENHIHGIIKLVKPQHDQPFVSRTGGGFEPTHLEKATSVRPGSGLRPLSMGGDTVHPDIYKSLVTQAVPQAPPTAPQAPIPSAQPPAPQAPQTPAAILPGQGSSPPSPQPSEEASPPANPMMQEIMRNPKMMHLLEKFIDELGPQEGPIAFMKKFGGQPE